MAPPLVVRQISKLPPLGRQTPRPRWRRTCTPVAEAAGKLRARGHRLPGAAAVGGFNDFTLRWDPDAVARNPRRGGIQRMNAASLVPATAQGIERDSGTGRVIGPKKSVVRLPTAVGVARPQASVGDTAWTLLML
ncbi:MAG: hypothetical protein WKG07_45715 [Hymenobacter sp.]